MTVRKGYSDGPEGQVHWRRAGTQAGSDLYCFSPAPFGSLAFANLIPHLANDRCVIAPDYPGQGGSDGGQATPTIEDYARSMLAVMDDLSADQPVSLLGFHSGCLVAVEAALQAPDRIERIILIDVPAFDLETRAKLLPTIGTPFEPSADLDSLSKSWDAAITRRLETQPLDQCLALFADTVGNGPRMNATFHAAFTYDVEAKLSALDVDTRIIATQSSLLDSSRRAAELIPRSTLLEVSHIQRSVIDENAESIARIIAQQLD